MAAGNVQTVLLMGGKSSWSLLNKVVALIATVVLTFLLVPLFGIVGAAVAWGRRCSSTRCWPPYRSGTGWGWGWVCGP
ncbi:polysaccharide biosynthesis C-terminal domain-containing protein [Streptosporangium lutulentum]